MEPTPEDAAPVRPDYRHAYPLIAIIVVAAIGAAGVRSVLVPKSFGKYGFYRAAALEDEQRRQPHHTGSKACAECHDDEYAAHAKDVHATVACETCHGPGWKHVEDPDTPLRKPNRKQDCLVCHRRLLARPGAFPQVDWREHFKFVGVTDPATPCVRCHSGHEPLFLSKPLQQARLHPRIHHCGDCHVGRTNEHLKRPPNHPQIFQCDYCHADITASAAKTPHRKLRCTTCHLFIAENAFSGRIVRNTNPKFCLLCHRQTKFKLADSIPKIEWPAHMEDVSDDKPDAKRPCVTCHQDNIHLLHHRREAAK